MYSLPTQSVIYAKLCTSLWKNPSSRDRAARTILDDILIMSPSALVLLAAKAALPVDRPVESIFPCESASLFLLVSDSRAWPGRFNEELLSCRRERETAQLLFRLFWKLNLSSSATLRLSSSGASRSSQSVDADFGIGIAIASSGRVLLAFLSCVGR